MTAPTRERARFTVGEDLFGEIEENSETVAISANIRGDTQKKLDRMKALLGLTTGEMIDQLVADHEREAQ